MVLRPWFKADPNPYLKNNKAIRKNVTVPEWLIRLADRDRVNYSEVITKALEKKLQLQNNKIAGKIDF